MNILLFVPDDGCRKLLEDVLTGRGHEIVAANDFRETLEAFWNHHFSLAFVDITGFGEGPDHSFRRLRQLPHGPQSILIAIADRDQLADLPTVIHGGADDYLLKPIDPQLVATRLEIIERQVGRCDILSIFNQLRVGIAMTDAHGRFTFLNETSQSMLGLRQEEVVGHRWETIFSGVDDGSRRRIKEMIALPWSERGRVPFSLSTPNGQLWVEIDIHDHPSDPDKKIYVIYDSAEVQDLRHLLRERVRFGDLIGRSPQMQWVFEQIRRIAPVESTVLIEGETGTGKELVAHAIHSRSPRKDGPFIAVNCGGLTESLLASQLFGHRRGAFTGAIADNDGVFRAADGGTLFLDEIGDIPMSVQASLLRVLQEREVTRLGESKPRKVNVRVVAATHHDLRKDVRSGTFRQDLLYRLRVVHIPLPPLRDRREDIPSLAGFFLDQWSRETGRKLTRISRGALQTLMEYQWPGNVRELKSAIDFAAIHCSGGTIKFKDLPPDVTVLVPGIVEEMEGPSRDQRAILEALRRCHGNRAEAARLLGIGRTTLYRRLSELGLSAKESQIEMQPHLRSRDLKQMRTLWNT